MAKFKIFSKDGRTVRYEGKPRYNGIFGSPSYVEFSEISSPRPISFEIGDYVDYSRTGFRYRLYNIPTVEKSARMDEYGNGFIYKNVQFYCATKDLEIALFRDVVFNDNTIHFSSIPNVDTYENVYGIAYRIQANLDAFYGSGVWNIKVLSTSDDELNELLYSVKQFSLSDGTCLDALNNIYKLWTGISWVYTVENGVNTITLGKPNVQTGDNTTDIFSYGKGNGLKVIARAVSSKSEMATRIYAYGSDRNMPTRYYNGLNIKDAESVYIPHLMLPLSDWGMTDNLWDASKAYVENTIASAKYGLIPKILRFDGSNDLDDIYPSIEGITIRQMAETGYPTTGYNLNERIDEIKSASNPADDGRYTEDSVKVMKRDVTSFNPYTDSRVAQPGQTYCTLGVDRPIIGGDSNLTSIYVSPGKFNIEFGGIEGYISGINGFTRGFPKITLDVKIDDEIIYTKHLNSYVDGTSLRFTIPDISFNNELYSGSLKVYVRVEIDLVYNTREGCYPSLYIAAGEVSTTIEYLISSTFTVDLKQIGFDLNEMGTDLSDGLCTISFKTGMCAGRDFVVKKCEYDSYANCWHLTCARQEDTALSQYFPNNVYTVNSGDRFVITDMQMPSLYVSAAMDRLHNAAIKALQNMCKPKMVYTPNVDSKAVYESEIVLIEGLYMPVQDIDLIDTVLPSTPHTEWVLIDNVTIAENDDAIPIWSVTLKDEKTENIIQKLTGEITRGNKFINAIREEGTRRPVVDKDNDSDSILAPKVYIDASADMFIYSDTGKLLNADAIVLTAVTEGINSPLFEWFYLGEEDWVALEDGSDQSYSVKANSEEYYQNGELVEDFKVIVTDFNGSFTPGPNSKPMGNTYEAQIRIAKVKSGDGLMVALNNPSHIFPATESHAIPSSDTVSVLAYRGMTPIEVEIGDITGYPEGMSVSVNKQDITIEVDENLVEQSGKLEIPVIVKQKEDKPTEGTDEPTDTEGEEGEEEKPKTITINLYYSWALALRGVNGSAGKGRNVVAYTSTKERDKKPMRPQGGHLDTASWTIIWPTDPEGKHTWGDSNELLGYVWMSNCDFDNDGNPITHVDSSGVPYTWTDPICITGEDGDNGSDGESIEFIYHRVRTKDDEVPSIPAYDSEGRTWDEYGKLNVDFIPDGWTDHPLGISEDHRVEYAATRKLNHTTGEWDWFIGPFLWACWGEDGIDGDGVEYIFAVSQSIDDRPYGMPSSSDPRLSSNWQDPEIWDYIVSQGLASEYSPWTDDPSDVSPEEPFEWVSIRRRKWEASESKSLFGEFSEPVLWARWSDDGDKGDKGDKGDDGYSTATIYLYKSSGSYPSANMPDETTYEFATGELYPEANLNGWSMTIPPREAFEHIYIIMANVRADTDIVTVYSSDWSDPVRFTGDNGEQGLMGKIMRGVNDYFGPTPDGGYQGMNGTGMFYDVVYLTASDGSKTYYYLEDENFQGMPGTPSGRGWVEATEFDFVATKVLLADNADIDVLSGNAIYLKNGDLPFAGMQGGEYELVGGKYVEQVNFFAGTPDGDPRNSKFKVYSDGSLYAENAYIKGEIEAESGTIGEWSIGTDDDGNSGLIYENYEQGRYWDVANYTLDGVYLRDNSDVTNLTKGALQLTKYGQSSVTLNGEDGYAIYAGGDVYVSSDLSVGGTLEVSTLKVDGEEFDPSDFVRSSNVKYIVKCSQAYYDSISPESDVMYVIDD